MARKPKAPAQGSEDVDGGTGGNGRPESLAVSAGGIRTGADFANFMSTMMSDVVSGRVTPATCNAACNAGGKLLKVVELQIRHAARGKKEVVAPELLLAAPGS